MQVNMRPAFRLLVAEHRAMIAGPLGPLARASDEMLARYDAAIREDIRDRYLAVAAEDEESAATCAAIHGYAARVDPHEQDAEQRRRTGESRHASGGASRSCSLSSNPSGTCAAPAPGLGSSSPSSSSVIW